MKDFKEIGKRMPYTESEDYISSLIEKGIDKAIAEKGSNTNLLFFRRTAIAASAAAAIFVGIFFTFDFSKDSKNVATQIAKSQPIDEVLNSLSDEQVLALTTYSLDDIPEY